jgi:branched-chain amino acid aminotransferase
MDAYYVNGKFLEETDAHLPVTDLAVLRGYGIFDFLRTYGRRPFHLEDHVHRLFRSARLIDLEMPWDIDEIFRISLETLDRSTHPEANIRIVVTGGQAPDGITPDGQSSLVVIVNAVTAMPSDWYSRGAKIITSHTQRFCPGAKTINYIPAILALRKAAAEGAAEAIYVDSQHRMLEGTTSNLFFFSGDTLVVPSESILQGITRKVILELASRQFKVEHRDVHEDEVRLFDEVLITSSNKEVVPVVAVDHITVGDGTPGGRTRALMDAFRKYTEQYARAA